MYRFSHSAPRLHLRTYSGFRFINITGFRMAIQLFTWTSGSLFTPIDTAHCLHFISLGECFVVQGLRTIFSFLSPFSSSQRDVLTAVHTVPPPLHPQHILFQTSHNRDIKNKKEQNNRSNKKEKKIKLGQQKSHPLIAIFLSTYLPLRWIIIFHTSHPLYCFNANMHIFISPPPLPTSSYLLIINLRPFLLAFASTYQLLMLTTCA